MSRVPEKDGVDEARRLLRFSFFLSDLSLFAVEAVFHFRPIRYSPVQI
jgi:hypothetical protein